MVGPGDVVLYGVRKLSTRVVVIPMIETESNNS